MNSLKTITIWSVNLILGGVFAIAYSLFYIVGFTVIWAYFNDRAPSDGRIALMICTWFLIAKALEHYDSFKTWVKKIHAEVLKDMKG